MELAVIAGLGLFGKYVYDRQQKEMLDVGPQTNVYHSNWTNAMRAERAAALAERRADARDPTNTNVIPPYFNQMGTTTEVIKGLVPETFQERFQPEAWHARAEVVSTNEFNDHNRSFQNTLAQTGRWATLDDAFGTAAAASPDMTLGVVSKDEIQKTCDPAKGLLTGRRDFEQFNDSNEQRQPLKLDIYTGSSKNYFAKKEIEPFFNPVKDMTFVNGMPNQTAEYEERIRDAVKLERRMERPFEPRQVGPGTRLDPNQDSLGGIHDTVRILPKNVDHLRRADLPKESYSNDPIMGKRGDNRQVVAPMMKRRPDKFREQEVGEGAVPKHHLTAAAIRDNFNLVLGNRAFSTEVYGPMQHQTAKRYDPSTQGEARDPNRHLYKEPDNLKVTGMVPVFNANANSFDPGVLERNTYQVDYQGLAGQGQGRVGAFNPDEQAKNTLRQAFAVEAQTHMGASQFAGIAPVTDVAKATLRNVTSCELQAPVSGTAFRGNAFNLDEVAKPTQRQFMQAVEQGPTGAGAGLVAAYAADLAKSTGRQTLEGFAQQGVAVDAQGGKQAAQFMDAANPTMRQTLGAFETANVNGVVAYRTAEMDAARETLRQTTIHNQYEGMAGLPNAAVAAYQNDLARATTRQTTQTQFASNMQAGYDKFNNAFDAPTTTLRQIASVNDYLSAIKQVIGAHAAYDPNDLARQTLRQTTTSFNYDPAGGWSYNGGYQVTNMEAPTTLKDVTKVLDYVGTGGNAYANTVIENYLAAHTNTSKEQVAKGRKPTDTGPKQAPTGEAVNMHMKNMPTLNRAPMPTVTSNIGTRSLQIDTDAELRTMLSKFKNMPSYDERFEKSISQILEDNPLVNNHVHHKNRNFG
jgi:hypothetical protein